MVALLSFLVLLLVSAPFYQHSSAFSKVPQSDEDRVKLAFNDEFDSCKDITDSSPRDDKKAADDACEQAFFALDRLRQNTCQNWREAKCRWIPGQNYRMCSCLVSYFDGVFRGDISTPIRECATISRTQEERTVVKPAPLKTFQQHKRKYDDAMHEAQRGRTAILSEHSGGAGPSYDPFTFGGAGSAFSAYASSGAGSAFSAYTSGGAGTSSGVQKASGSASRSVRKVWASGRYRCAACPRSYSTERNLKVHVKMHETDETKCPVCHRLFTMKGSLISHLKYAHPEVPLPKKKKGKRPRPVVTDSGEHFCHHCGKKYATSKILLSHEKSHNTLETHCFDCNLTLSTKGSFKMHMRRAHPKQALAMEAAENERYIADNPEECEVCKKRFKNAKGLLEHSLSHEGRTTCDVCGAVFSRRANLYTHKATAHPE